MRTSFAMRSRQTKPLNKWKDKRRELIPVAAMRDYMVDAHRPATLRHKQTMEEIRELLILQREQRFDIMALFHTIKRPEETGE